MKKRLPTRAMVARLVTCCEKEIQKKQIVREIQIKQEFKPKYLVHCYNLIPCFYFYDVIQGNIK